jgi:hypothetical protein
MWAVAFSLSFLICAFDIHTEHKISLPFNMTNIVTPWHRFQVLYNAMLTQLNA